MRLIKILLMITFFVCSIVFFVQNMTTLSKPLALRFDPLPTFSKIDPPVQEAPVEVAVDAAPATAAVPTESFLAWKSDGVPLYIVVLATFVIGVLFSSTFFLIDRIRHTYRIVGSKRKIRVLDGEVKRLKAELAKLQAKPKVTIEAVEGTSVKELPAAEKDTEKQA